MSQNLSELVLTPLSGSTLSGVSAGVVAGDDLSLLFASDSSLEGEILGFLPCPVFYTPSIFQSVGEELS